MPVKRFMGKPRTQEMYEAFKGSIGKHRKQEASEAFRWITGKHGKQEAQEVFKGIVHRMQAAQEAFTDHWETQEAGSIGSPEKAV